MDFLTRTETCTYLGMTVPTLQRRMDNGLIPYYQESKGCKIRFLRKDLDKYIEQTKIERNAKKFGHAFTGETYRKRRVKK